MPSLSDTLKRLFGAGSEEATRSIVLDGSDDAKRIIGARLYDGVMAEVSAAAGAKKLEEFVRSSREHCDEHLRTEERLKNQLQNTREANRIESNKGARLGNLLGEIGTALDSGRTLTSADIRVGKRNALNLNYLQIAYLPAPKPRTSSDGKATTAGVGADSVPPGTFDQPQA